MGRSHQTCSIDMKGRGNRGEEAARSVLLVLDLEEGSYGGYALTLWLLGTAPGSWREAQAVMPQTLSSFLALGILSVWWCFQTAWLCACSGPGLLWPSAFSPESSAPLFMNESHLRACLLPPNLLVRIHLDMGVGFLLFGEGEPETQWPVRFFKAVGRH